MRYRHVLAGAFFPTLFFVTNILLNNDVRKSSAPSMTFKWKSRVKLQGHINMKEVMKNKLQEAKQIQEELSLKTVLNRDRSVSDWFRSSEGLLNVWKRNQLHIVNELQNIIRNETTSVGGPVQYLIQNSLIPPSSGPLKTSHGVRMTHLVDTVDRILGSSTKGFFVEANAYDGEGSSHTLWLEKVRGWSGLLVEPDPSYFLQALGKNRRSWILNAALSPSRSPALVMLEDTERQLGGRGGATSGGSRRLVPAYPLHSILLALNRTHVDFLCLDVGGDEWSLLQTIPWDDVSIGVIAICLDKSPVDGQQFVDLLTKHGYRCYHKPEVGNRKYVTESVYVICNQQDPDTYVYQEELMDVDER